MAFWTCAICVQFAVRPTGSTTAELDFIKKNHHIARVLETNDNIGCLSVDFGKAFDIICHIKLVEKMKQLDICYKLENIFLNG